MSPLRWRALVTLTALALTVAACGTAATATPGATATSTPAGSPEGTPQPTASPTLSVTELTVAWGPIPEPQGIAHQKGWFEQELGVPINWITLPGGAATIAALQSGSLQIGCGTGTPPITAATAQGVDLDVFWIQDDSPQSLVVRADRGISSVKDLAGKKIATIVGSTMYYDLVVALNKEGVALSDVTVVDLPVPEGAAAFQRGDVDGTLTVHPQIEQLVKAGGVELLSRKDALAKYGYSLFDACFTSRAWAADHADVLAKWVAVEDRAVKYVASNPDDAYAAIAQLLSISPEEAKVGSESAFHPTAADQAKPEWLGKPGDPDSGVAGAIRVTAALAFSLGRIPQLPANPQSVVDATFVQLVASQ